MTRCDRCDNAPIIRRLDLCDVCVVEVNQLAARVAELEDVVLSLLEWSSGYDGVHFNTALLAVIQKAERARRKKQ